MTGFEGAVCFGELAGEEDTAGVGVEVEAGADDDLLELDGLLNQFQKDEDPDPWLEEVSSELVSEEREEPELL